MSCQEIEGPIIDDDCLEFYSKFESAPVIIEGPQLAKDLSYFLVNDNDDLKDLERGVPLSKFEEEYKRRESEKELEMEFRVLSRLNCHKSHYLNLYKSPNLDFKSKNRYNEVLPFNHSRVKL